MADLGAMNILDDDPDYGDLLSDVIAQLGKQVRTEVIRALAANKEQFSLTLIIGFDERVLHSAKQLAEAHKIKVFASKNRPPFRHENGSR